MPAYTSQSNGRCTQHVETKLCSSHAANKRLRFHSVKVVDSLRSLMDGVFGRHEVLITARPPNLCQVFPHIARKRPPDRWIRGGPCSCASCRTSECCSSIDIPHRYCTRQSPSKLPLKRAANKGRRLLAKRSLPSCFDCLLHPRRVHPYSCSTL